MHDAAYSISTSDDLVKSFNEIDGHFPANVLTEKDFFLLYKRFKYDYRYSSLEPDKV
jgi:hypothetical protein